MSIVEKSAELGQFASEAQWPLCGGRKIKKVIAFLMCIRTMMLYARRNGGSADASQRIYQGS